MILPTLCSEGIEHVSYIREVVRLVEEDGYDLGILLGRSGSAPSSKWPDRWTNCRKRMLLVAPSRDRHGIHSLDPA